MPGNRGAFRIGILFLCIAILDGVETEVHFPKKYRNYKDLRVWQKKRMIPDIIITIGSMLLHYSPQSPKIFFIIADIIICIGFVWLYLVDHFFRKKAKNETNKASKRL